MFHIKSRIVCPPKSLLFSTTTSFAHRCFGSTAGIFNNEADGVSYKGSLDLFTLRKLYAQKEISPSEIVSEVEQRIAAAGEDNVWIFKVPSAHIHAKARALEQQFSQNPEATLQRYPLYGIPFAVKDNIDVAGYPTTSGCPGYSYTPWKTSPVIQKLQDAGAILIGKNNMDQFASGLVGVRTPYGTARNPFNPRYVPGGSSSGSAVAVSAGLVSFSVGTDTAGSGRVPAAFNNLVGLKPTKGLLSTTGLVPACRSLDCLSVFALTVEDSWHVLQSCKGFDPEDEYSRREPHSASTSSIHPSLQSGDSSMGSMLMPPLVDSDQPPRGGGRTSRTLRLGIPARDWLAFFGDSTGPELLYRQALQTLKKLPSFPASQIDQVEFVEIDFRPFVEVARVLYEGPWVAERLSAISDFFRAHPDALHPITRGIMTRGESFSAVDTFLALRRLEKLRREASQVLAKSGAEAIVVPTASITPTIEETLAVPIGINTVLGYYTNFVNLLDMCGVSVPSGFLPGSGMPTGISFLAPAFRDEFLYRLAGSFQYLMNLPLGATGNPLPPAEEARKLTETLFPSPSSTISSSSSSNSSEKMQIVVVGAHMSGLPLNYQLTELGGKYVETTHTKGGKYRLYDLWGTRPGLVATEDNESPTTGSNNCSSAIEVEVWELPLEAVGKFLNQVQPPLSIGTVTLKDGRSVKGFLCEAYAVQKEGKAKEGANDPKDITEYGGWRSYLKMKMRKE